ncbi:hypothetical protein M8J75_007029 [Diaphorina citri]|nr:hypothetical protein M8J75_007029 [Diaphorina citri]
MISMSDRLKTRLTSILKYAISSVFILVLITAALSKVDYLTGEAYYLINHQIYHRKNLHWGKDKEIQLEKVIQIVCLPIPCSLIFVIYEFLIEIYELIVSNVKCLDENVNSDVKIKANIKQLKVELMRLYNMNDEDNEKTHEFVNELRMNQIESILDKFNSEEMKQEYLKNLVNYNKYVIECNRHCQYIEEASLL